jgi:DNA-binding NtrC family response regulator
MSKSRILLVDDEPGILFSVRSYLESNGFAVQVAESLAEAARALRSDLPEVVVVDHQLPDGDSFDFLRLLRESDAAVPVVVLTAHGSIDLAVRAIKEGAYNFLTKPVELVALLVTLRHALEDRRNRQRHLAERASTAHQPLDPFMGGSAAIRRLADDAHRVLEAESPVLIQGETGSGKGVLARWLHARGPRAEEAFVDLNCAGLSRDFLETELFGHCKGAFTGAAASKLGLLETAHRGTVFLDEIGDVDPAVQPKLLKVIEERRFRRLGEVQDRRVDVRLVAATHRDLNRLVSAGTFRADLYFRVSTIPLLVPPLRERREDVPLIAARILEVLARETGKTFSLSPAAAEALQRYRWPGNLREMRNVLERAVLFGKGPVLGPGDLRFDGADAAGPAAVEGEFTLPEMERKAIEAALEQEHGRVARAASRLGIPRSTLYQRLKQYGIDVSRSS